MFELVWLHGGDMVLREEIGYKTTADAVAYARARAADVAKQLARRAPDSSRLIGLSHGTSSVFSIVDEDA
jgi:hypothetical protein